MNRWAQIQPDGSVVQVGPTHCPAGHELAGRVLISSTVDEISYLCRQCGLNIHRRFASGDEIVTQDKPT